MAVSTRRSFAARVMGIADIMSSANKAASALEAGRRPSTKALKTLGIDPVAFDNIGRS
ncbi:hypothetical protein [Aurantimonas sp. Leaf443]|uniref:hypothetical protein n=1 Tax=Aurantimonas sp. Leaf443 TaxID=1736378 RepID=UPI000A8F7928|nr:hypothetical protein [Aurantimonas sp. Leaf443]